MAAADLYRSVFFQLLITDSLFPGKGILIVAHGNHLAAFSHKGNYNRVLRIFTSSSTIRIYNDSIIFGVIYD